MHMLVRPSRKLPDVGFRNIHDGWVLYLRLAILHYPVLQVLLPSKRSLATWLMYAYIRSNEIF